MPAEGWGRAVGPAILGEVQKVPAVFDKVKWAYDAGQLGFSLLLGSSRILLLDQVRESLAPEHRHGADPFFRRRPDGPASAPRATRGRPLGSPAGTEALP